jgi:hypothetical protein
MNVSRFMAKVEKTESCWLWIGHVDKDGYGRFKLTGQKQKLASRIAFELFVGAIPEGMEVCHQCDVRNCVNPAHLFVETHQANMLDMKLKNRGRGKIHVGELNPVSKLKEFQVKEIRASKGITQMELAVRYQVSKTTIFNILRRKVWIHV